LTTIIALGDRDERYLTHREIDAALALLPTGVDAAWVGTDSADARDLAGVDGIWLTPGGPYADDAAVAAALDHCLDGGTPFLGTCSGFQYACLALARRAGVDAVHAEVDPHADAPMIRPLACTLYGEERTVTPKHGTIVAATCGAEPFIGFHFCGYGLAAEHEAAVERAGAVISARAPDMGVEAIELPAHPFFVATAFQPQVGASSARRLHPLIARFVEHAASRSPDRLRSPRDGRRRARPTRPGDHEMTLQRMDNVLIVVEDLEAAKAFFAELGMELEGEATNEGPWVDRVVGLDGVRADLAMMRTPDGHGRVELTKFHTPPAVRAEPEDAPANALGIRRIMFAVDDVDDVVARLRDHGAELVGEIAQYEDLYRLCFLRGPEGIILGLAERLS
jgi:catechol 2,3-dioxygenase-like lactoylglutathione lyase family enzyme